jgi:hypothetical protein
VAARTPTTASHRNACRSDEEARRNRTTTETTTTIAAAAKASEIATNNVSAIDETPGIDTGLVIGSPSHGCAMCATAPRTERASIPITNGRHRRDGRSPEGNTSRYRTIPGHTVTTRSHEFSHKVQVASSVRPSRRATVVAASVPIVTTRPRPISSSSHPQVFRGSRDAIRPPTTA